MASASFLLPGQEGRRPYGVPLAIQDGISSTFQEFRSNHFHAGIDLRTLQRTGFPVLAIADGAIEKISVSNRGFGRSLLLRHADGNSTRYGHLERFRADIEAVAARVRAVSGKKYFTDYVLPAPLPVRQGELIATSGESGAGFPHLHVEIRDGMGRALNPLGLIAGMKRDSYEPRLRGFLLRSRGGSLINGDCGEFYFKLKENGSGYSLDEPVTLTGSCDIVLDAFDLSSAPHVAAPYSLEADLSGRRVFQIAFDLLTRDDNNQLGMLYDMAYSTPSTYFFNLCSQSGFALERTGVRLGEELLRLPPGPYKLRVTVRDRQGNQAQAMLPVRKVLPGDLAPFKRKDGREHAANGLMQRTEFTTFVNQDDIVVKVKDFPLPASRLALRVLQGGQELAVPGREYSGGVYFCFKPLNHDLRMLLRFELAEGGRTVEMRQKALQVILLRNHYAQSVRFHDFAAEFGPTSVREPAALLLEQVALKPEYPMLAGPVRSEPFHFAFLDSVFFKFRVPEGEARPEQLGIFKYHPAARNWSYVPTLPDHEAGYLSCRVLTAGTFALLRDIFSPVMRLRRPRSKHLGKLGKLVVRLSDKGKGIDEEGLAIFLNGQKVDGEYDPDRGQVLIEELHALKKGRNDLLVLAADLAGNHSKKRFYFSLR